MNRSLRVGRIAGIPLYFHWTFLGVLLWMGYDSWRPGQGILWSKFAWLGMLVGLVFFSILLHELGHALTARRFGVETNKIVLYPLGGGAFLREIPKIPAQEIWIAVVGPLVNLVLAAGCAAWIWLGPNPELGLYLRFFLDPVANIVVLVAPWERLLVVFFILNIILGGFNLLPAFPLDGGRILRALLCYRWSRERATFWVACLGMIGGAIFLGLAFYLGDTLFGLGAVFIFGLAAVEARVQRRRMLLRGIPVSDHVLTNFERVYIDASTTLAEVREVVAHLSSDRIVLLLNRWQEPQGVTNIRVLMAEELTPLVEQPLLTISKNPRWRAVRLEDNLLTAAEKLDQYELFAFPVLNHHGELVGLLPAAEIKAALKDLF